MFAYDERDVIYGCPYQLVDGRLATCPGFSLVCDLEDRFLLEGKKHMMSCYNCGKILSAIFFSGFAQNQQMKP